MYSKLEVLLIGSTLIVMVSTFTETERSEFEKFKGKFKKKYKTPEKDIEAMTNFLKCSKKVAAHNSNESKTYKTAVYNHSDLSKEDFKKYMTGFKPDVNPDDVKITRKLKLSNGNEIIMKNFEEDNSVKNSYVKSSRNLKLTYAKNMNFTDKLSPVKDQGPCGSCWAFAATALLEFDFRKIGSKVLLSEQHLVDCLRPGKDGCDGASITGALHWTRYNGLAYEHAYPYKAKYDGCTRSIPKNQTYISPYCSCYSRNGNEDDLMMAMNKYKRPLGVAVQVVGTGFDLYKSGVFYSESCVNATKLDHAVVLVGYGNDEKFGDFWIVRNSWGRVS